MSLPGFVRLSFSILLLFYSCLSLIFYQPVYLFFCFFPLLFSILYTSLCYNYIFFISFFHASIFHRPLAISSLLFSFSLSLCFYLSIRSLHSTSTDGSPSHYSLYFFMCLSLSLSFSILSLTFSVSHFLDSVCSTTQVIILFLS